MSNRRRITHIHFQGYVLSPQKQDKKEREMWVIGILKISKEQIRQRNRPTQNQIHRNPPFSFPMRMPQMIMALQNLMIRFILCSCILRFVVVYFSLVAWFIFLLLPQIKINTTSISRHSREEIKSNVK